MSRIFLGDRYVYKLKKPVSLDFLDYSNAEARRRNCEAEVRLNRRLAASIYLGVVPVCVTETGELRFGEPGKPIDWLVKMRRLPARHLLDQALADETVRRPQLEPVIRLLARFCREAAPAGMTGGAYMAALHKRIRDTAGALCEIGDASARERVGRIVDGLTRFIDGEEKLFFDRARRVIDGHGDLRPEHIYFGKPPAIIDCVEFNRDFRLNDPVDEISFLDMECRRRHSDWIGAAFLDTYCAMCHDFAPQKLMAFYRGQRALLRAKLTLWHLEDYPGEADKWHSMAEEYLLIAAAESARLA